jgi:Rha family phage regulatory protein
VSAHKKAPALAGDGALVNESNYQERNVMTNTTTVVDMRKFVEARNGEVFTTSQHVAEAFGKLHNHVLAKVRGLECSAQFLTDNFSSVQFEHRGNTYEAFEMTKDGFMFLVMGFTGKKAAAIKESYIAAFNWMAEQLSLSSKTLVANAVEQALGVDGARKLSNVMRCRVAKMDVEHQRSATAKLSSALHARFGVPRLELIPASQMDSACNFVASYAIEGEYLAKEAAHKPKLSYPIETLVARRASMMTVRNCEQAWLDVTLHDLRDLRGSETPCEELLGELQKAGYDIEGCWWELRTYRNKLRELASFASAMTVTVEKPQRYAVKPRSAA